MSTAPTTLGQQLVDVFQNVATYTRLLVTTDYVHGVKPFPKGAAGALLNSRGWRHRLTAQSISVIGKPAPYLHRLSVKYKDMIETPGKDVVPVSNLEYLRAVRAARREVRQAHFARCFSNLGLTK